MASITMTASLLTNSAVAGQPWIASRRSLTVAAASVSEGVKMGSESNKESSNGRRDLIFSVAAIAVSSVAGIAVADGPKRGTPEAKKAYYPVCVTMPTAKICHK